MKNKPKISVIMPNYNGEEYLVEAIESILHQTFKNFEFIIIDDGSTDNSMNIIKRYAKRDKRIKLLVNKHNLGIIRTLNRGLRIARGKYIARMDSDDISLSNRFEIQYNFLENNPDIFLIGTSFRYINEKGRILYTFKVNYSPEKIKTDCWKKSLIHHPTVMFHNEAGIFYREKAIFCEDRDLWLRLIFQGKKMKVIEEVLLNYRLRENSICNSKGNQQKLFIKEVLKWHKNRLLAIEEGYNSFNPDTILTRKFRANDYNQINYIDILFKSKKNMKLVRQEIINYWSKYGLFNWKPSYIYYLVSLMPKLIVNLAIKYLEN